MTGERMSWRGRFAGLMNLGSGIVCLAVISSVFWRVGCDYPILLPLSAVVMAGLVGFASVKMPRAVFLLSYMGLIVFQAVTIMFIEMDYQHIMFDAGRVVRSAMSWANGASPEYKYFWLYPFNQYIEYIFFGIFKLSRAVLGTTDVRALMVANACFIDLSILLTVKTARLLMAEGGHAYVVGTVCSITPAFCLFVPVCYSDTVCLPFLSGGLLLLLADVRARQTGGAHSGGRWHYPALAGALLYCGYAMKGCPVFMLVAGLLYAVVTLARRQAAVVVGLALVGVLIGMGALKTLESTMGLVNRAKAERYRMPLAHNVMMGLRGLGGYDADDVNFTRSFPTLEEKQRANIAKIKERVGELGLVGLIRKFRDKSIFTWAYGDCGVAGYIGDNDKPIRKTFLHSFVLHGGRYWPFISGVSEGLYLGLLLLVAIGCIRNLFRAGVSPESPLRMFLSACMLFFMVWEAHPRYSFHARLAVILLAMVEVGDLSEMVFKKRMTRERE